MNKNCSIVIEVEHDKNCSIAIEVEHEQEK